MTSFELLAVGAFLAAWTIEAAILKLNPGWLCNAGIPAFWCEQKLPISNGEPPSAALIEQHLPEPIAKDLELRDISSHQIAIIETVGYAAYMPMLNAGITFDPIAGMARITGHLRPQVVVMIFATAAWNIWIGPSFAIIICLLILVVVMYLLQVRKFPSVLGAAARAWTI